MVEISVHGDRIRFSVQGWDQLWALKSALEIPGVLTAGTFYQADGAVFYDVHDPERTIVLELDHEHYRRLVVEVADPPAAVAAIDGAIRRK